MGKVTKHTDWQVVVTAKRLGDFGLIRVSDSIAAVNEADRVRQYNERCEQIIRDIKRHVDNVSDAELVVVTESTCEHCGEPWTEVSDTFNGGCCDKDWENDPETVCATDVFTQQTQNTIRE